MLQNIFLFTKNLFKSGRNKEEPCINSIVDLIPDHYDFNPCCRICTK